MVAAGATVLMAASEESSSNGTESNTTRCETQSACSHYKEVSRSQQNAGSSSKKELTPSPSNSTENKGRSHILEKNSRLISRTENKDNHKNHNLHKTTPIRETRTSRLRAASIISPNGGTVLSRRLGMSETPTALGLQPSTSLSVKEENSVSDCGSTINPVRDKSYKRKSYLNRSLNMEAATTDRLSQSEHGDRRTKRQSNKQGHISETISTSECTRRQAASNSQKKHLEPKVAYQRVSTQYVTNRSKPCTSTSITPLASIKCSNVQRTSSGGHSDSEVSRRVDALTALTKATMERVEKLASHANLSMNYGPRLENDATNVSSVTNSSNNSDNSANTNNTLQSSPRKYSILKKSNDEHPQEGSSNHQLTPVSILKHKASDGEAGQTSSNAAHTVLPVTFSPSVVEPAHKRHGILKKRSSLDESEILRRRSCSPDVSFTDNSYSEFRPILKNQRRSSLDEIIKRDQSPDQQPTSILKRKSSREDDREDRQPGSGEPQSILKRKSTNNLRTNSICHHVTITTDATSIPGPENLDSSEVRPILKKKHSREESFGSDPPSHEPRPILKKKSSTESDEHDDKPKKTILKCSRKNSQDECNYEAELTSPKKLSMLRNRALQCRISGLSESDLVRPILKQPASRDNESRVRLNVYDETADNNDSSVDPADLFSRKRAQSVGHVQSSCSSNELNAVFHKRRSLELSSMSEVLQDKAQARLSASSSYSKLDLCENSDNTNAPESLCDERDSMPKEKFPDQAYNKDKQTAPVFELQRDTRADLHVLSVDSDINKNNTPSAKMTDSETYSIDPVSPLQEQQDEVDLQDNSGLHRSNSVSKMTLHFKSLQEKANSTEKDNLCQRTQAKASRGIQRYRDRKLQGNDRFNTQPVTFQEVQEAVLQNQRNATSNKKSSAQSLEENSATTDDEFDPSKLSLAERVRLFNQKIATENTTTSSKSSQERHSRRRPVNRYKTQPITSEEVEVASRISPLNTVHQFSVENTDSEDNYEQVNVFSSQGDVPKSILKPVHLHAHNSTKTKSPELVGLKLIKSVLKKESEVMEQQGASDNCDIFPRSILKTNLKSEESNSCYNTREVKNENNVTKNKNPNVDTRLQKQSGSAIEHSYASQFDFHSALNIEKNTRAESMQYETKQTHTVPFPKNPEELSKIGTKLAIDDIDNAQASSPLKKRLEETKSLTIDESLKTSDDETSSGGREVHSLIKRESSMHRRHAITSKQTRYASLSKSASHHALSNETYESESFVGKQHAVPLPGLYRSATQAIPTAEVNDSPGMSIADRLAALQRSGNTNWKRRIATESTNLSDVTTSSLSSKEELKIKQGVLADCLGKLESAAEGWKKRIAASDVTKFTVAGKMKVEQVENLDSGPSSPLIEVTANITDRKKKVPRPERFRARKGYVKDAASTPTSPSKDSPITIRGSFSEPTSDDSGEEYKTGSSLSPTVSVPKTDDETFTSFFTGISLEKCEAESLDLRESDFDMITTQSELLIQKRNIRIQRRRVASRNPIKALAARTDLRSEYTEIRTGVAEKVMRELNIEKLAKNSPLAIEALAGLASTEDFSNVTLRNAAETSVFTNRLQPYKDLMLMLVKGRRHVQVRLVEPVAESMNSGDNFILVTKSEVYNYIGKYSNVIEKARGAEIAMSIQQNKDLGCQASQVITINEDKMTCSKSQLQKFWNYLGTESESVDVIDGGHPDEDELYESAIIDTNMVYEIKNEELVPLEKYWGAIPKIEMLDPNKVLVFDFGSEMYIWSGKGASSDTKRLATHLATEMWKEGYDYTECAVCPISAASMIGNRTAFQTDLKCAKVRPKWCLFAKLTQHVETVLFREKFLDWPNVSGIIRVRGPKSKEQVDATITIEACNVNNMLLENTTPVDLILEGSHLGRGTGWYDDELKKQYVATNTSVTVWHIDEFSHTLLDDSSVGQFFTGDSYIIRWMYSITITGRELSGLPSKHSAKGRDRSVYFIWQGQNASLNEQGAAALLTVELDSDQAPQIRVVQGHEPAAFLNLFSGGMVIHSGKKTDKRHDKRWRLYICRGTLEPEVSLVEIPCSTRQLRSRGSLALVDTVKNKIYVWHGSNVLLHIKKNAFNAAEKLKENRPDEVGLSSTADIEILEINEGSEPEEFFAALGGMNKKLYVSLDKDQIQGHTPRLFYLSSISKEFTPTEILCPHRADLHTPFPFLQEDLYQVNQPALFLLDNKNELWIWQGWWPDNGAEDQTGSKAVRWQAERRAAMTTAMQYWESTHSETTKFPIYLVWAGLEPLQFINLFPTWTYRDDIAELNIEDGRNSGEVLTVESELARLTQSTYPPAQLLQRPLPEGVDPTHLELYLSEQHFEELLGMGREDFQELPVWKQVNLKKEIGLF